MVHKICTHVVSWMEIEIEYKRFLPHCFSFTYTYKVHKLNQILAFHTMHESGTVLHKVYMVNVPKSLGMKCSGRDSFLLRENPEANGGEVEGSSEEMALACSTCVCAIVPYTYRCDARIQFRKSKTIRAEIIVNTSSLCDHQMNESWNTLARLKHTKPHTCKQNTCWKKKIYM